jgi:hypothetical protein
MAIIQADPVFDLPETGHINERTRSGIQAMTYQDGGC